jgi:hypothetical protein
MFALRRHALPALILASACSITAAAPLTPAAGDRIVANSAIIGSEFQRLLEEPSATQTVNYPGFIDETAGVRIYHRDDGLLFAISTKRNLTLREKAWGERQAQEIALKMLQEKFSHLIATEDGFKGLDAEAVRVIFVEPDATAPYIRGGSVVGQGSWYGAPSRYNAGPRSGGVGACGSCNSVGDSSLYDGAAAGGSGPLAFAPSGYWAGSTSHTAPCTGCH